MCDNSFCLRFLRSSRQVDCARKIRQQTDLTVLIQSLLLLPGNRIIPISQAVAITNADLFFFVLLAAGGGGGGGC